MDETVALLADVLQVECAKVLQLLPGGRDLILLAGAGWKQGRVGHATVSAGKESQAGYTLATRDPVIVKDLSKEKRFAANQLQKEHGIVSGVTVVIGGGEAPFGVLGIDTAFPRTFDKQDTDFLQAAANILAAAIERRRAEEQIQDSRARMSAILNTAVDGVITIDVAGTVQSFNPAAARIFGYEPQEVIGQNVRLLMPDPDRSRHDGYIHHYLDTGEKKIIGIGREVTGRRKNGETFPMELAISEMHVSGARMFTGITRDITERKAHEEELQRLIFQVELERQRVKNLVSNVPGVVWEAWGEPDDASQRIDFVSDHVEKMLGYSVAEWLSTPNFWLSVVHPEDRERAATEASAIFTGGHGGPSEFRWVAKDGSIVWVEAQSRVIRDEAGNPAGMRGVTMDITARRAAEAAIRESEERFSRAFHASPAGVTITSADDRRFIDVNEAFLQMLGWERDEVVDRPVDEVGIWASDADREKLRAAVEQGAGTARNVEVRLRTRSGDFRHVLGSAEVIYLGGQPCVLALMYDITDRKLEERRREFLAEASDLLASSLDYESTLTQIASLLAGRIADLCSIDIVRGDTIQRLALAHADPQKDALLRSLGPMQTDPDGNHPVMRVVRTLKPELYSDIDDALLQAVASDAGQLQALRALGARSAMIVPLMAGSTVLGTITLVAGEDRERFMREDLEFAQELARRAGLAIDNALRYGAEQAARQLAEEAVDRIARLQELTSQLSESLTAGQVADVVISAALETIGARSGIIAQIGRDRRSLALIEARGVTEQFRQSWETFAAEPPRPILDAIVSGGPMFLPSREQLLAAFPQLERLYVAEDRSFACLPLAVENYAIGAMVLTFTGPLPDEDQRTFILALAGQCAQALERARLYEAEQRARDTAELAALRTARLQGITAGLSEALTPEQVAEVILEQGARAVGAAAGIISLVQGEFLEMLDSRGFPAAAAEDFWKRQPLAADNPLCTATRTGMPVFIASPEELSEQFPDFREAAYPANQSAASMPLTTEGRTTGVLGLCFQEPREFGEEDKAYLMALARLCGQALERARLYASERHARTQAEQSAEQTARLQALAAALSQALTPEQVVRQVIEQGLVKLGVATAAVGLLVERGEYFEIAGMEGFPDEVAAAWRRFPNTADTPFGEVVRTLKPAVATHRDELMERYVGLQDRPTMPHETVISVPLLFEGRPLGAFSITYLTPVEVEEQGLQYLVAVGRLCAQALERARLYQAEAQARAAAEIAERQQAFLAEASTILSASLEYATTLSSVARLCVPYLADWCAIDVLEADGSLNRVAVMHNDPDKIEFARRLQERYPPDIRQDTAIGRLLAEGMSIFYPEIPDEVLAAGAQDAEHLEVIRGLGIKSAIGVPLKARGRTLGAITLVTSESGRVYTPGDLALAEDLGRRAGLAVDNARLFQESQQTQEELRRANEAKDEFLGLVSHELRTPITTIFGGARLLRSRGEHLDAESRSNVLDDIEHESERLHRIVEDLLVLARVELGQEVITEPVLVQRVAERTASVFARRAPDRTIRVTVPAGLDAVRASAGYLEQVLRNLVNNSDKYSPTGEEIEITAERTGDEVTVSVLDRGPGIPQEEMDLIFERFYRSTGTARQAGGAGIGLTVCRRLVEAQGGRIWAAAREGGGLQMSFSLPVYEDR